MRRLLFLLLTAILLRQATAATTNFFEGFESGLTNWVAGDGNPDGTVAYWAPVNGSFGGEGTRNGSFKAYCAGVGFSGTTASPAYRNQMASYLSRSIDLSGYTNATLSFWSKIPSIETLYDFARVLIDNTVIWSTDRPHTAWTNIIISLEPYLGGNRTLTFQFYSDTSQTYEGWYIDDVLVTDAATPAPPPGNDNFSAAQALVGATGLVTGSNRGATSESGEPHPGNSVWYRWTAGTNGFVTFRTGGSTFDTVLCAYTGTSLAGLLSVACDDNGDSNNASLITFNATGGMSYFIAIRGSNGVAGAITLSWIQTNGIGSELLPDLTVWANEPNEYLYGWYVDQLEPTQPGRTLLRVSTATPNSGAGPLELRGSSTMPGVQQRIFRADGSYYERFAGNFTFHPGHGHLHFDNWINLHLRTVLPNGGVGPVVASGDKTSFAIIDLRTYDPDLPGAPESAVYNGGLIQGLSVGWADVYHASLQDQWIDVTDVPSGTYWLEAVVDPANSILESNETNNSARILINLLAPPPVDTSAPANDHFTNAFVLNGPTAAASGRNNFATHEPGEPLHVSSGEVSVWWRWTAPSNMPAVISTDGSSFDTVLAVYTGSSVSALALTASDDDAGLGSNSRVSFNALAGVTYFIAVDGYSGDIGTIELNLNPAFNDAFANCLTITGYVGSVTGSTRGATRQSGEPVHAGAGSSGSIWYCWRAPTNAVFEFTTAGSSFDTVLGVYTGTAVNALTLIASDNDSATNWSSRLTFTAVSNALYYIAVDGPAGSTGMLQLAWSGALPPSIVQQPIGTNAPSGASVSFRVVAAGSSPLSYQWRFHGTNLADTALIQGTATATLTQEKILPHHMGVYTVVISNAFGSVTSAPANLIVLDNPRVVFVEEVVAHSSGEVHVPVEMQALGDEHFLSFTLAFEPAWLSRPRLTNAPVGAALVLNTNQVASGLLGVTLTLPAAQTFPTGHVHVVDVLFDATPISGPVQTYAGFEQSPVPRAVADTNGSPLAALFVAGVIDLLPPLRAGAPVVSNGVFHLSFNAASGQHYALDASQDLINWTPLYTNAPAGGPVLMMDTNALPHRFYRLRLVPHSH